MNLPLASRLDPAGGAAKAVSPTGHGAIPSLDGFRAIAIILVMLSHFGLERIFPGQFGVTLFFFLSGYLITTLLRQEQIAHGSISLRAFYLRRFVRIVPPMLIAIALAVALALSGINPPLHLESLGFDLTFLTNYFPDSSIPIGLWSLAVEEHFYLLFPALLIVLNRTLRPESRAVFLLGLCAVVLGIRCFEVGRQADITLVTFWTHTRIDSILFGSILALWNNPEIDAEDRIPPGLIPTLIAGILLVATFAIRDDLFRHTLRWTLQGLALIVLFNSAIRNRSGMWSILDSRPLKFVAALSYVLYLVHSTLFPAMKHFVGEDHPLEAALLTTLASFALALVIRHTVELPLGQWRRNVERQWREQTGTRQPVPHSALPD